MELSAQQNNTNVSENNDNQLKNANCLICMESLKHKKEQHANDVELVRLVPCMHAMCNECFFLFTKKLNTDKCPSCTQTIQHYQVTEKRQKLNMEEQEQEMDQQEQSNEVIRKEPMDNIFFGQKQSFQQFVETMSKEYDNVKDEEQFSGLDHAFFREEVEKLLKLHQHVKAVRLKEQMRQKIQNTQHSELEMQTLHEIECQLHEMHEGILGLHRFDPNQWVVKVQQSTETLLKIKSGQFSKELGSIFLSEEDCQAFDEPGGNDDDFGFEYHKFEIQQVNYKQGGGGRKSKNRKKGGRGGQGGTVQTVVLSSGQDQ